LLLATIVAIVAIFSTVNNKLVKILKISAGYYVALLAVGIEAEDC